jgi:hypothetical protein
MNPSDADLAEILQRPGYRISPQGRPVRSGKETATHAASTGNPLLEVAKRSNGAHHSPKTDYKAMLVQQLSLVGIEVEPEYKFSPRRKYRADWRVIRQNGKDCRRKKVLIEFEGGLFSAGKRGHSSIAGIIRDCEKGNEAVIQGFAVIRVAPNHVVSGIALKWIEEVLK